MQWLQVPNPPKNVDNINNVRCVASRHGREKKKERISES
jgi:hypothetical protein